LASRLAPAIAALAAGLGVTLDGLATRIADNGQAPDLAALGAAIAGFGEAWSAAEPSIDAALRRGDGPKAALSLPFAIETLRRDLGDFVNVMAAPGGDGRAAS
jgi:hypothetical protein